MKPILSPPGKNVFDTILELLRGKGQDFSSTMVVFPGKRPSLFLRKALAGRVQKSFIPPAMFSMDEFVDFLCDGGYPRRPLDTIDAVSILYDIHTESGDPLGEGSFMTPDSFFPLGLKLYRDIEELYIEGVSNDLVKMVQPFTDEEIPVQTMKRLQSLSYFYEKFYHTVDAGGLSTRSMRYRTASGIFSEEGVQDFQTVIFAGFYALTHSEKVLFKKILAIDKCLCIFFDGPGIIEKISALGIHADRPERNAQEPLVMFYQSADTHGQVYAARTVIEEKLKKKLPLDEKTVIVLPSSDTLFPVLRQGLAGIDESSYNISLGYPLFRTPVYGFINALMDVVSAMEDNRVYVPHYLRFVLHPYTKNIYFDGHSEITRIIFHTIEEFLLANRTRTFVTLSEIEDNEQIVTSVLDHVSGEDNALTPDRIRDHIRTIHHHTIGRFIGFENVKDFAERGITILSYIYQNSTARQHPLFHPFSEAFINSLETLAGSLMKDIAFSSQGSYFLFLRKYIATIHIPFEGTPVRGIQVLGFLETRCLHFDTVLLMDTNEEVIPDTQKEDTLLPHKARQMLGLPTYTERDQLTAYYFDLLVRGAGEVHIFFSENEKKEKSRFVEKLLWEKQKRDQTKESKQYINLIQYRVKLENKSPRAIEKTESVAAFLSDFLFNATALDSYLRCPAQFYYSYVLNLDKKDEMTGDIQRSDTGTFVHRVLTQYLSRRKGVPLREKDLNVHEMYRLIDTLFSESYGKNPAGAVYLLKKQITRHLSDFLLRYYLPLVRKETVTILETEHDLRSQENFFRFRGRLDCIEKRGDTVFIIDFKTGSSMNRLKTSINDIEPLQRDTWSHAIGSLQLPCYLMLYSGHTGADIRGLNGMFLLLGRTVLQKDTIELPLFESDCDPVESFGILKQVIMSLIREIQDQSHPFVPTTLKKELCPSCDFRYLCGTQWHIRQR